GFEAEALSGLSQAVPALSFEFTTIQRAVGLACIERCVALGYTQFNAAIGESQALGEWRSASALADWLANLPHAAKSGDIYVRNPRPAVRHVWTARAPASAAAHLHFAATGTFWCSPFKSPTFPRSPRATALVDAQRLGYACCNQAQGRRGLWPVVPVSRVVMS